LTKRYRDKLAVDGVSLQVPRGTAFGFIGPNGAGKTTTIRMLMGMLRATSGRSRVLGLDPIREARRLKERVGYVPEMHFIYRWMRVGDVLAFCRSLYENWNDQLCSETLDLFGLDPRVKVKHLSKGMVVKLALLIATTHEPELLILDEPTSGLDPLIREEFLDGVLRTVCERQQTVLFSSHTLSDVQRLADTIGLIYDGRLLVHCPTDELLTGTKRIRVVLRDGSTPEIRPEGMIWQQRRGREWLLTVRGFRPDSLDRLRDTCPVDSVEVIDLGLEEVFKDFVKGQRASA
jgi:ABC-2 type transport system ATP-binding protein